MELSAVTAAAVDVDTLRAQLRGALVRRDATIRDAFDAGWPEPAIAQAAHLTQQRVSEILGRPYGQGGRPPRRPAE